MVNEMLERLTGHDRYRPLHPAFSQQGLRHGLIWSSAWGRWAATCKAAAVADRVEELHAVREQYLRVLQAYTHFLKALLVLEPDAHDDFPERSRLQSCLDELAALHAKLSARWVTLDDLYAITAEYLSPTAAEAVQLAAHSPPPQAWYDEDADPFSPVD
ncbi:hypothetical protein [Limnoglobus roseus]|uniref:Uncharacterized protein n=1 Tax=Limnoglobus roseus TaxID=2598579 RepID=A0A5C1A4D2_9BACT|nr:hypothetical protein [Limnoglobus roseus]QEL13949.1 hypothetical protein PX52LOC_00809 [Limnoglobus roseus]